MKIVIAGSGGQIGTMLARHFYRERHAVITLSRRMQSTSWQTVVWDGATPGPWTAHLEASDAWINLASRSVNCRYTRQNRMEILRSRVRATTVLHEVLAGLQQPTAVWLNASTATIYRHALDRPMDEAAGELGGNEPGAPRAWNFSIKVAKAWKQALFRVETPGTRQVALRSAIVLSPDRGGIFDVLLQLVRYGLGGTNLPGTQFVSWMHEDDFICAVKFLIATPTLAGPVNLAAPHPLPNRQFMRILRRAWGARIGLPTLPWMLEIGTFLLRTESELVMKSRRVVPGRLLEAGFSFRYPEWEQAAPDLVARWRERNP